MYRNHSQVTLKKLFQNNKQLIIAEIGQSHDGSLNYVHSFIDECAKTGVDIVKFQAHYAEEESTEDDYFRTFTSYKKESRFEYWKRMEFTDEEWFKIAKHVKSKKLLFSASVFSEKSIYVMKKIGIDVWKIASGESLSSNLINNITNNSNKPIFISTGMSYNREVEKIYNFISKKKNPFLLMHCTSQYPSNYKNLGINIINDFLKKYKCPIGYSDHSGSLHVPLVALEKKISALEVHVTFDKKIYNPDSSSSINFTDLRFLCEYLKNKNEILKFNKTKDQIANIVKKNRIIFSKSLAFKNDMKRGTKVKSKDLTLKKPGNGIKISDIKKILGKKLKKDKSKIKLIKYSDVK
ncbi:N-acetylneuraminate synthase family protein [Candidatus Pelagibacter sp.]|nr:N-acetylneuraminate synthase family protein [Candidatus Pelagibacter sp.]